MLKQGSDTDHKLFQQLGDLPLETHLSFATRVRDIIASLPEPRKSLTHVLNTQSTGETIRFAAFYGLLVDHWRDHDFAQYRVLVDKYEHLFKAHPLFPTFRSQYYSSLGNEVPQLTLALDYASKAIEDAPGLPNVLHLFAELVARLGEISDSIPRSRLIEAERTINQAIAIDEAKYAKYFATKARILSLMGRFAEARTMIDRAVELEPSDNPQYAIRLGDYQEIRTRVGFMEQTTRIRQQQEEALQRLEEVRLRVVELLGLLAAVIAFLVTGTQISQGLKFEDGARMMVVVGGMILLVFSAYSMVFYSGRVRLVQTLVLGLGLLLAGSALFGTDILHMLHWRSGGK